MKTIPGEILALVEVCTLSGVLSSLVFASCAACAVLA